MRKLTRKNIGDWIEFEGFDGKRYKGLLADMRRRVAVIEYSLFPGGRLHVAYLEPKDHNRVILTWR